MKPLIYTLVVLLAAATLVWVSGFLGVIAFASPQNPAWKTWLYVLAYCGAPVAVSAMLIGKSLQALWSGRSQLALGLVLIPTFLAAGVLAVLYGLLDK
jgi:hypothetical protein